MGAKEKEIRWYESSTGSGDLSITIKGLLVSLLPLFIAASQAWGVDISEQEWLIGIEAITGVIAGGIIIFGLLRKIFMAFKRS